MVEGLDLDFKCFVHNESFKTPAEFYEHKNQKPHGNQGETLCVDCASNGIKCKVQIDAEDVEKGKIPVARCDKCLAAVEKQILARKARLEKEA